MASFQERTPAERATLIFQSREQGEKFMEHVGERLKQENMAGVKRDREAVAEAVAEAFAAEGEAVNVVKQPWDHTPVEHEQAQALVNAAFAHDLSAALKQARASQNYPRILDLFHDALTNELYEAARQYQLNRQPLSLWLVLAMLVLTVATLAILVIILFA